MKKKKALESICFTSIPSLLPARPCPTDVTPRLGLSLLTPAPSRAGLGSSILNLTCLLGAVPTATLVGLGWWWASLRWWGHIWPWGMTLKHCLGCCKHCRIQQIHPHVAHIRLHGRGCHGFTHISWLLCPALHRGLWVWSWSSPRRWVLHGHDSFISIPISPLRRCIANMYTDPFDNMVLTTQTLCNLWFWESYESKGAEWLWDEHINHIPELIEVCLQVISCDILCTPCYEDFSTHNLLCSFLFKSKILSCK